MKIKQTPEDFLVDEVLDASLLSNSPTAYHLCLLRKTNYTTERAVQHIARAFRIPRKIIGYAGAKDKQAITSQYITLKGVKKEKLESLQLKDIQLEWKGYATKQLTLGDLEANTFTIVVYEPDFIPPIIPSRFSFPNYFGEQRFSKHNVAIGKALLHKDFKAVAEIIIGSDDDYGPVLLTYLQSHLHDYVGAIHRLPKKILLFYVHAVQSALFNQLLAKNIEHGFSVATPIGDLVFSRTLQEAILQDSLPLIGYDSSLTPLQEEVLCEANLATSDFIIKQFPELSLEGKERKMFVTATNCTVLSQEKNCIKLSFTLPKGTYATIALAQLFAKR